MSNTDNKEVQNAVNSDDNKESAKEVVVPSPSEEQKDKTSDEQKLPEDSEKTAEKSDNTPSDDKKIDEKSDEKKSEEKSDDKKADEKSAQQSTDKKVDDKKSDDKKSDDKKADNKSDAAEKPIVQNPNKQGFGEALALARKKKGMSVDDVAKRLNRLKRQIEAIEAEDYEALPQYAFAKGFAGSYARLVGLDDMDIGRRFDMGYPPHLRGDDIQDIHSPLRPMGTLKRDRMPIRLNAGLIAGIVAVLIFGVAMLKMINNATKSDSEVAVQGEQVADSLSPNEQAIGAAVGDTPVVIGSTGAALTGSAVGATAGAGVLDFWLKESTNIKVVDSTGVTLMTGEQKKGGYQLTGKPPFKIEITQPSRVDLNFNKNPVNLASHTKGNKAVFTLQ